MPHPVLGEVYSLSSTVATLYPETDAANSTNPTRAVGDGDSSAAFYTYELAPDRASSTAKVTP